MCLPTPVIKLFLLSAVFCDNFSISLLPRVTTSLTSSTMIPTLPCCSCFRMMILVARVSSSASSPIFKRRLMTGRTSPRRLMTPFKYAGTLGTLVICCILTILSMYRISIPYCSSPRRITIYWKKSSSTLRSSPAFKVSFMLSSSITVISLLTVMRWHPGSVLLRRHQGSLHH